MLKWLHEQISEVCPIEGIEGDASQFAIHHKPEATPEQIQAAQSVAAAFNWNDTVGFEQWRKLRRLKRRLTAQEINDLNQLRTALQNGTVLTNAQLTRSIALILKLLST